MEQSAIGIGPKTPPPVGQITQPKSQARTTTLPIEDQTLLALRKRLTNPETSETDHKRKTERTGGFPNLQIEFKNHIKLAWDLYSQQTTSSTTSTTTTFRK